MNIRTANAQSYVNIAKHICKVNRWDCKIYRKPDVVLGQIDIYIGSQYDVAYEYFSLLFWKPRVIYMTVEGGFVFPYSWDKLRSICKNTYCIVPTKWGKSIMEEHGVHVTDVVYHAIPDPPEPWNVLRSRPRPYDIVHLNAYYQFLDQWGKNVPECERKGWRWWPQLRERFSGLGFVNVDGVPRTVTYRVPSDSDVYYLLALGKVYTSLTTHEGFGLNPIMALMAGTKVVGWDIEPQKELIGDVQGVYLVPVNHEAKCYASVMYGIEPAEFVFKWGDIYEYISAVEKALNDSTQIDYSLLETRFSPNNYLRFAEFLKR